MNDKAGDNIELDDVPNRSWAGSSSSSSSSSPSDSSMSEPSTSSSSDSSSRGHQATLMKEIKPSTRLNQHNRMDTASNSESSATITSGASVRRYKNSPFGLSHHYLSMPDPGPLKVARLAMESSIRGQQNKIRAGARREWKKRPQPQVVGSSLAKNREASLEASYPDLEILAPVSSATQSPLSSPSWPPDYGPIREDTASSISQANEMSKSQSRPSDHTATTPATFEVAPGLDAEKCNSKSKQSCKEDYLCHAQSNPHPMEANLDAVFRHNVHPNSRPLDYQDYDCLLVRFSSIMYATFLVILGCILHCSELRQKSKNSSDHIYTIIVALIGIAWLLFLQADLQRYKRYASKYILIESIFNDNRQKERQSSQLGEHLAPASQSAARSTSSSSASLVNDRMSMNTEVIFKKTAYKMYQRRAAASVGQLPVGAAPNSRPTDNDHDHDDYPYQLKTNSRCSMLSNTNGLAKSAGSGSGSGTGSDLVASLDRKDTERLVPAYKFLHGKMGANFYLKCGMAAFCFGHVIHEGLRFGQQLYFFGTGNVHCRDLAALIAHLITPLYSFYQLFMMFKYSNLVINRHRVLAKFGLMHIVGTSVTFWIRTILEEAYEDFVHKMDYFKSNRLQFGINLLPQSNISMDASSSTVSILNSISKSILADTSEQPVPVPLEQNNVTVAQSIWALMSSPISATITPQIARHLPESYACAQNTLLTTKSMNALPYLYPFTIEYNLLLAATFLSLYFNIGKIGPHGIGYQPFTSCHLDGLKKRTRRQPRSSFSISISPVSHLESSDNVSTLKGATGKDSGEYKSNFVVNADCHSANKGLFCGFFVLLVTLVTIVIFFVTISKPSHVQLGIKINLIQEGVLTTLILIVVIVAFKQVSKLNRSPYLRDKVTTDDVLMLIPLPFFFFHSLLSFRAETASLYKNDLVHTKHFGDDSLKLHGIGLSTSHHMINVTNLDSGNQIGRFILNHRNLTNGQLIENFINDTNGKTDNNNNDYHNNRKGKDSSNIDAGNDSSQIDHFKLINVALNIVVMIEVLVQTNFIIDGMRRSSESRYLRFKKPGRELITFAILLNITYWIVATFETKSVEQYKPEIEYYGPLPYMFISHTTLPVMLFYRYHSSVCLAEIWNRAYKPTKRR